MARRSTKTTEASATETTSKSSTVLNAAKSGASAAKVSAGKLITTVNQGTRTGVYQGVYAISYGVVFASMVVGSLLPGSSVVKTALSEGSKAAVRDYKAGKEAKAVATLETSAAVAA